MRVLVLITLACLSACSWFSSRKHPKPPDPTQIIVTGAPAGSLVFVDGVQSGQAVAHNDQTQVLEVAAGTHKVEIRMNDKIVYREDTYVRPGEHGVVIVASGFEK